MQIAEQENADMLIGQLAVLLHDVDDVKLSPETHEAKKNAVGFMKNNGVDEKVIASVCKIIDEVSFAGTDSVVSSTLEGKCVQDADRLDAIGAIGIARTFAYGGSKGRRIHAMLNKAYNQIKIAEEMVEENKTFILEEYFGESFKGIIPDFVDYFVITNYSVGTGRNCILPSPIILESHYLSMMKLNNGMYNVHYALSDNGKGYIQHVEKRYARYLLSGYKIMVPEYLFKINAPRL